jgi:hypothetical protein
MTNFKKYKIKYTEQRKLFGISEKPFSEPIQRMIELELHPKWVELEEMYSYPLIKQRVANKTGQHFIKVLSIVEE